MKLIIKLITLSLLIISASCGKKYLDYNATANLIVPRKLEDFQAMLDNTNTMNESSAANLGLIGGDEYYVTAAQYATTGALGAAAFQKNAYIWAEQIYIGRESQVDWSSGYNHILLANYVFEGTDKIGRTDDNQDAWDLLRGSAYFFRGYNLFMMAQLYCPVYNAATAGTDLGLSLRTDSDPTMKPARASVEATYQMIIEDLQAAEALLKDKATTTYRPGKAAVYATLTRVYMQMGDYAKAAAYADKCLAIQNGLINFNSLNLSATITFPGNGVGNAEVIFMENTQSVTIIASAFYNADTTLLKSYTNGDLRSKAYFTVNATTKKATFKGSYKGSITAGYYAGLATDEVYLNRAECLARLNNPADALADLNKLRQNRFTPATYVPLQSTDAQQVLDWIVAERRKEMVMRGTRWPDLRRLNKEPRYATTLTRVLDTQTFELKPNDQRWTWPLPVEAIENGGYEQNPR
ncbi:hypothetical protein A4H97_27710 [Niastella yeongjuensis]|uniref:Carbohydrate-binding protein SusD n=1 Tax=Niastella yeongjuensis TaxID=354355 RepID=A0A1V9EZI2_9BACT|nr:RagB/SusD family nutrient uptake outer membrane protein [Niastella yeongjuensis]OQP51364.1 hypothetical protein A4H97_27710 [Niastella yeongjuensis]SEP38316.1 SusD family protein [Niastella yeongjuensis]